MRGIAIVALAVIGACNFNPGTAPGDSGTDGPPPVTVGFAQASSLTDESAGTVSVRVVLSAPADAPITVNYAFVDGSPSTATRPGDYLGTDGTLTFAPGDVEEVIEITVGEDSEEEADEDIRINLSSPTGGADLGTAAHTVTISANTLPRINFSVGTSMNDEGVSPTLEVTLDKASQLTISATIAVTGGTATGNGTDFSLSATTVTFQPGDTSETINLTVMNDTLDENDETAVVEIQNPVNVVAGTTLSRMHTILDNDNPPDVGFTQVSSSVAEGVAGIDVEVSLTTASGLSISVPFSVDNASSAVGADYMIPTASPLVFDPGETTKIVRVNVVDDAAVESNETVVLALDVGMATNVGAGANLMHSVTLNDNDSACVGAGAYQVCFATPSNTVNLSGSLNTDSAAQCSATQPISGWAGQPAACFVVGQTINVAATTVTGSRPLVLVATGNITVTGTLDVASRRGGTSGPGANTGCGNYTDIPGNSTSGAGGGAGGTFRTIGGNGGNGNGAANSGGSALAVGNAPMILRGGCAGQNGGNGASSGTNNGQGGAGGGAVYLVAGGTLTVNSGVALNASGAAGSGGGTDSGGGGGGSGGMIVLHATAFAVTGAVFMANGGGGAAGGDDNASGVNGNDPTTATPTTPAAGGDGAPTNAGANGGNGFAGSTGATAGGNGGSNNGGGGGGGGGGYIVSNLALTGATVSAGDIDP